jgi:hypothetical protein
MGLALMGFVHTWPRRADPKAQGGKKIAAFDLVSRATCKSLPCSSGWALSGNAAC